MEERSESTSHAMARSALLAATAGILAALVLAAEDIARIHVTHGPYLSHGVDRMVHILAVLGTFCALGPLLGGAIEGWLSLCRRIARKSRYLLAALAALPLVVAVAVLNTNVLAISPLAYLALLLGFSVTASALFYFATVRYLWIGVALIGAAALHADATMYLRLYTGQHQTLALLAASCAIWLARRALQRWRVLSGPRIGVVLLSFSVLAAGLMFSLGREQVSQNGRFLSYEAATMQRHAVTLLSRLTDWDRDGVASLLGGGDCDNFNAAVHPLASELPMNGTDDDCIGGDLTEAATQRYLKLMAPEDNPAPEAARHLVFITVDALRHDRMIRMPNLQAISETGMQFERMYVTQPTTTRSLYSVAASIFPSQIELSRYHQFRYPIEDPHTTLAQVLKAAGFSAHGWMFHHMFQPKHGFTRGFDSVWTAGATRDEMHAAAGGQAVDKALAALPELAASGERLFLWIHLYDPHHPYQRHDEYDFGSGERARYDSEVAYTDAQLDRFMAGLRSAGIADDAVITIFSDHGEEFGDHGGRYHGTTLYEETVRVPAVMLVPGKPPRTVSAPTSTLDLAPTMLDYLGLGEQAPASFRGRSLRPMLEGVQAPTRPVFIESERPDGRVLRAVVKGPWKLIYWQSGRFFELYNLEFDPGERANVYDLAPDVAMELEALLGNWMGVELSRAPPANAN